MTNRLLNHLARLAQQQGARQEAQSLYAETLTLRDQVNKTSVIEVLAGFNQAVAYLHKIVCRDQFSFETIFVLVYNFGTMLPVADDQVHLEQIVKLNRIDTRWFLPFLIYRLKEYTDQQVIQFEVTLQGIPHQKIDKRVLELSWRKASETLSSPPIQTSVITEWAAYGMACVVVPFYTGSQIAQVTQSGERFDFWVRKDEEKFGLEVSGTLEGKLEQRQRILDSLIDENNTLV